MDNMAKIENILLFLIMFIVGADIAAYMILELGL